MDPKFPQAEDLPDVSCLPLADPTTGDTLRAPWDEQIEFCRLDLGGTYLSYIDVGDGPPVVMIPGWMGTAVNFAPQIAALSENYRVLCFDPIGSGHSDRPSIAYTPNEHFRFARRFIEKLRVWPAAVVGHSMGGAIAYALAAENPELVGSLVMIAPRTPVPGSVPAAQKVFRHMARRFPSGTERMITFSLGVLAARIARANVPKTTFANAAEVRDSLRLAMRNSPRASARTLIQMDQWSEWSGRILEIEAPSLLIWGRRDRVNPIGNKSEITAGLPEVELEVIEGAGHLPMLEKPDLVTEILHRFVGENLG